MCLEFVYAAFDGPIPTTLGDLGSKGHGVLDINLKSNKFTGVLPSNIVQLTALEKFDVSNNQLKGELPLLHKLPKLDVNYVNLAGNDFACPMPSEDLVYDTATCTCKAGSKGVKGQTDGELWDPKKCRSNKSMEIFLCHKQFPHVRVLGRFIRARWHKSVRILISVH